MLRIVSAYGTYPIRQVDLVDGADSLAMVPRWQPGDRNEAFERSDHGLNVAFHSRRMEWDLRLPALSSDQVADLYELCGLSKRNRTRVPVHLFPNFDRDTIVSAPLCGSIYGLHWNPDTSVFDKSLAASRLAKATGYVEVEHGRIQKQTDSTHRFIESVVGRGVVLEPTEDNLMTTPHPSAGTPGWTAVTGSPTIAHDSGIASVVETEDGATRISTAAAGTIVVKTSGTCSSAVNSRLQIQLWVRGNCQLVPSVKVGAQTHTSGSVDLRDHNVTWNGSDWHHITVGFQKTDAATSFDVELSLTDDGHAREIFCSAADCREYATPASTVRGNMQWSDSPAAQESLGFSVAGVPTGDYTVAMACRMPPFGAEAQLFHIATSSGYIAAAFSLASPVVTFEYNNTQSVESNIGLAWSEGDDCTVICRHYKSQTDESVASVRIARRGVNGGNPVVVNGTVVNAEPELMSGATILNLHEIGYQMPMAMGKQWIRMDRRGWTDAESVLWEKSLLQDGFRELLLATRGRTFLLGEPKLEPIRGRADHYTGSISATEIDVDTDFAAAI